MCPQRLEDLTALEDQLSATFVIQAFGAQYLHHLQSPEVKPLLARFRCWPREGSLTVKLTRSLEGG